MSTNNNRSRKSTRLAVAGVAAVAAVVMAGCGSSGKTSTGGSGTQSGTTSPATSGTTTKQTGTNAGTITWWASPITTSGTDPRQVLIKAFEKAYPSIHVKLENGPSNTDTNQATLTTQISGGGGPDVFMGDVTWPAQFAAHQLAIPISKYLSSSYFKTFAPGLISGSSYKGQVIGAPFFEDQGFLYYRKDILAEDHLPVPTTWSQLQSEALEIVHKGQTKEGYVFQADNYEGATCDFMEFLADAGGSVLNTDATKSTLGDTTAALKALTTMRGLVTSGASPKAVSTFQEPDAMNAFQDGLSAFMRNWDYAYGQANSKAAGSKVIGKVGVAPLPGYTGTGYSNIGGWDLYVNPHSKNIKADITFIKYLTSVPAQKILATQFSEIPTNQTVRTMPSVKASNPVLAIVPKTKLVPRPTGTPNYSKVSQAIYNAVNAVVGGTETPAAGAKAMESGVAQAVSSGSGSL